MNANSQTVNATVANKLGHNDYKPGKVTVIKVAKNRKANKAEFNKGFAEAQVTGVKYDLESVKAQPGPYFRGFEAGLEALKAEPWSFLPTPKGATKPATVVAPVPTKTVRVGSKEVVVPVAKQVKVKACALSGMKITKLTTLGESKLRTGCNRYLRLEAVLAAKNTDEVLNKDIGHGLTVTTHDLNGMVSRGHIKLG